MSDSPDRYRLSGDAGPYDVSNPRNLYVASSLSHSYELNPTSSASTKRARQSPGDNTKRQKINPPVAEARTQSPWYPASPPIHPTSPPIHPTSPPIHPTSPPIHPTSPPIHPTSPPIHPTSPPSYPASPQGTYTDNGREELTQNETLVGRAERNESNDEEAVPEETVDEKLVNDDPSLHQYITHQLRPYRDMSPDNFNRQQPLGDLEYPPTLNDVRQLRRQIAQISQETRNFNHVLQSWRDHRAKEEEVLEDYLKEACATEFPERVLALVRFVTHFVMYSADEEEDAGVVMDSADEEENAGVVMASADEAEGAAVVAHQALLVWRSIGLQRLRADRGVVQSASGSVG